VGQRCSRIVCCCCCCSAATASERERESNRARQRERPKEHLGKCQKKEEKKIKRNDLDEERLKVNTKKLPANANTKAKNIQNKNTVAVTK